MPNRRRVDPSLRPRQPVSVHPLYRAPGRCGHRHLGGQLGDSYDNALAESIIGLFKTEVINFLGPWKSMAQVEWETLQWVSWYNNERLHGAIGHRPPQEVEGAFYAQMNTLEKAA